MNYGATLLEVHVPDRQGVFSDVVAGYKNIEDYFLDSNPWFGATVGRYANRIGKARFELNGKEYNLPANDGSNHLHGGGTKSLSRQFWDVEKQTGSAITFMVKSADGDEGYPGNLIVKASYELTDENEFLISYDAVSDQDTVINLTNHAYWNLSNQQESSILNHKVQINASSYARKVNGMVDGSFVPVAGDPLDFSQEKSPRQAVFNNLDFFVDKGIDHSYLLRAEEGGLVHAASYREEASGRRLDAYTTEPSVHLYTGNFLDIEKGKYGQRYDSYDALCFECQNFPDAPNNDKFPSALLKAGERYSTQTKFKFSVSD